MSDIPQVSQLRASSVEIVVCTSGTNSKGSKITNSPSTYMPPPSTDLACRPVLRVWFIRANIRDGPCGGKSSWSFH